MEPARPQAAKLSTTLALVVGLVLLVSGWEKAANRLSMGPVLRFLLPSQLTGGSGSLAIAAVLVGLEVSLGLGAIFLMSWRVLWGIVFGVLLVYTGVLIYLTAMPGAPACGCLGARLAGQGHENTFGIVRNAGLLLASIVMLRRAGPKRVRAMPPLMRGTGPYAASGFSVIELIVSIAVVAVLVALALPALRGARGQARQADTLSMLRQLAVATTLYQGDFDGVFPYMGIPGKPWEGLRIDGQRVQTSMYDNPSYFAQTMYYANLLVPGYFDARSAIDWPGTYGQRSRGDVHFISPYEMTATAFAAPRYWLGDDPPDDLSLYRAVRVEECAFPSNKGLLLHFLSGVWDDSGSGTAPLSYFSAAVDGAASSHPMPDERALDALIVSRAYGAQPVVTISTRGGMGGRDF